MDPDLIFINKLADLRRRVAPQEGDGPSGEDPEYRLLMAAPLLRDLLFSGSIVDRVRREHKAKTGERIKLSFRCVPIRPRLAGLPRPALHIAADGFAMPDDVAPGYAQVLTLDQFLKASVAVVGETAVSVYDVVEYLANAAGGVHYDPGNIKGNREAVNALHKALIVGGFGAVLYAVLAIGRVSLTALQPLADAVIKDTK